MLYYSQLHHKITDIVKRQTRERGKKHQNREMKIEHSEGGHK